MTWLTEHPTTAYILIALLGGFSLLIFVASRRVAHLGGLLVAVLLAAGVYLIDRAVVTDREQVEMNTYALAKAAQDGDHAALGRLFSDRFQMDGHGKDSLLARARTYLTPGGLRTIWVSDVQAKRTDQPQVIVCGCNAGASGYFERLGTLDPPYLGTLDLVFEKEGDQWRIVKLTVKSTGGVEQRIP